MKTSKIVKKDNLWSWRRIGRSNAFFQTTSTRREDGSAILTIKTKIGKATIYASASLSKEEVQELRNHLDMVLGQKTLIKEIKR